jgi:energy-coupling factor transporter ATP-binding protein EcfA2
MNYLEYAHDLEGIIAAFEPEPLRASDMAEFYYPDTMPVRVGDDFNSPIKDLYDNCTSNKRANAFLLLGHQGCGKSTELNNLGKILEEKGFVARVIYTRMETNFQDIDYQDVLVLLTEALLKIAQEVNADLERDMLEKINDFWKTVETEEVKVGSTGVEVSGGASVGTPALLSGLLKLVLDVKTATKFSAERRSTVRESINRKASDWLEGFSYLADAVAGELGGRRPVIIVEDLDKIGVDNAFKVFCDNAALLSQLPIKIIYTFPIGCFYDTRFSSLRGYFEYEKLPMIETREVKHLNRYEPGIKAIKAIVFKRADRGLFEDEALDAMVLDTGGSLRDLFHVIVKAASRSLRREAARVELGEAAAVSTARVELEDVRIALKDLRSDLTRLIERRDFDYLVSIHKSEDERKSIDTHEGLLRMMAAGVVFEYNCERWHYLHPLVAEFLREQGEITSE